MFAICFLFSPFFSLFKDATQIFYFVHEPSFLLEKIRSFQETYIIKIIGKEKEKLNESHFTDLLIKLKLFYTFLISHESHFKTKGNFIK